MSAPSATTAVTTAAADPLGRLLRRVRREARAWVWLESLALVGLATAAIFWGSLAADWLIEPPAWVRGVTIAAAVLALATILATRLVGRLATPLTDRGLALAIERSQPHCGDTLSTAVTLAAAAGDPVDAELAARTAVEANDLAARVSVPAIFRRGRLLAVALAGLGAAASVAGLAWTRPAVASLWARRLVWLDDTPWPRRVQLEAEGFTAGVRKVARGSDVDLLVRVTAAGELPEVVELRSRSGAGSWQTVRMGTRGGAAAERQTFGHLLEAVGADLELEVRGGDARLRGLRLEVVEPPALAAATIRCTLPDYLGGGRRDLPASRVVAIPRGSRVEVALTATKPLAAATLLGRFAGEPPAAAEPPAGSPADSGDQGAGDAADPAGRLLAAVAAGDPASDTLSGTIESLDGDCTLVASFTDTDGVANRVPVTLVLSAVPDEPPRLALGLAGISTAVTPSARLPIVGTIEDDHGLAAAAVSLDVGREPVVVPLSEVRGGTLLMELPPDRPAVISLAPLAARVGERATVVVTARDGCTLAGGPNTGSSETWLLEVVTAEALQAMLEAREVLLRRRFEATIEDLSLAARTAADGRQEAAARRLGEAAARAIGETGEIATAFRGIRDELANNGLVTPELETRLVAQIAEPLVAAAAGPLERLAAACRAAAAVADTPAPAADPAAGPADSAALAEAAATAAALPPLADAAITALRAVLSRMLELESFNEVVEKLRGVIEAQERLRRDTLEQQRKRARELLE
jgi:hypothetical protein